MGTSCPTLPTLQPQGLEILFFVFSLFNRCLLSTCYGPALFWAHRVNWTGPSAFQKQISNWVYDFRFSPFTFLQHCPALSVSAQLFKVCSLYLSFFFKHDGRERKTYYFKREMIKGNCLLFSIISTHENVILHAYFMYYDICALVIIISWTTWGPRTSAFFSCHSCPRPKYRTKY